MASVRAALRSAGGSAYVQALQTKAKTTKVVAHDCPSCGTHVSANYMTNTFCPSCGDVMIPNVQAGIHETQNHIVEASIKESLIIALGDCPSCGHSHVGNMTLASADHMHCIVCGTEMKITAGEDAGLEDEDASEMSDGESDMDEDMSEGEDDYSEDTESEDDYSEDEPEDESEDTESENESEEESEDDYSEEDESEDTSEMSDESEEETEESTETEARAKGSKTEAKVKGKQSTKVAAGKTATKKLGKKSTAAMEDFAISYGDDKATSDNAEDDSMNELAATPEEEMAAAAEGDLPTDTSTPGMAGGVIAKTSVNLFKRYMPEITAGKAKIGFLYNGATDTWLLTAGNTHIASAVKEKVGLHLRQHYQTQAFATAFNVAIKNNGITAEVEKNFGLEPVTVEMPVSEQAMEIANQTKETLTQEANITKANLQDHFRQCFDLAIAQLSKGLANRTNPLREGFIQSLAANGIPDAQPLVDKIIANTSAEFINTVLARTDELLIKNTDALNEIAHVTAQAAYKPFTIDDSMLLSQTLAAKATYQAHTNNVTAAIQTNSNETKKVSIWARR